MPPAVGLSAYKVRVSSAVISPYWCRFKVLGYGVTSTKSPDLAPLTAKVVLERDVAATLPKLCVRLVLTVFRQAATCICRFLNQSVHVNVQPSPTGSFVGASSIIGLPLHERFHLSART
jgi:hypothetical protein